MIIKNVLTEAGVKKEQKQVLTEEVTEEEFEEAIKEINEEFPPIETKE